MRSRNIKPGYFTNDELLECEPLARILFAGLWGMADRKGRLEDRPKKIKIELLPCDNCEVDDLLNQLRDHGFILRYVAAGRRYIQVINFEKHQNPHHKELASVIPPPSAPDFHAKDASSMAAKSRASPGPTSDPPQSVPADTLIPDSQIPELPVGNTAPAGERGSGKSGRKPSPSSRLPFDALPPAWEAWAQTEMRWDAPTIADVWACFRDYWQAKAGKAAQKSDWEATWRMWCRRQIIRNSGGNHGNTIQYSQQGARQSKSERARAAIIESAVELGYAHPPRRDGED